MLIFYFKQFEKNKFLFLFIILLLIITLGTLTNSWDARSIWLFKSKIIFYDNSILSLKLDKSYLVDIIGDTVSNPEEKYQREFYIKILSDIQYSNYNQLVHINAIKGIAQDINCNYYYLTDFDIFKEYNDSNDNSLEPRDLIHYTVDKQNLVYEQFKKLIKGEKSG